jgi:hypothetical protein
MKALGIVLAVMCGIGALGGVWLVGAQPATTREVSVNVEVRAADGVTVQGVAVCALVSPVPTALTDTTGVAHLQTIVPTEATCMYVTLAPSVRGVSIEEHNVQVQKFFDVTSASAFSLLHKVTLLEGQATYSVTIAGAPKVSVRGKIVNLDAGIDPTDVGVHHANALSQTKLNQTGNFQIGAIRKDAATELYVYLTGDTRVVVLPISSAQAGSDIDLGEISIGSRQPGRRVDISVSDVELVRGSVEKPYTRAAGLTLVSQDGASVHCLRLHADGHVSVPGNDAADDPRLPPGTYYACPGILDGHGEPKRLLDLLRQQPSRIADLDAASVPKLTIPSDGVTTPVTFQMNAPQAENAVSSVR